MEGKTGILELVCENGNGKQDGGERDSPNARVMCPGVEGGQNQDGDGKKRVSWRSHDSRFYNSAL